MTTPFDMNLMLAFGFCGICIYVGVFFRSKIKFFQSFLVPACMVGGLLGMILMNLKIIPLREEDFQTIAYHFFIISFISIGLTSGEKAEGEPSRLKERTKGALWMGLVNGASMSSQAFLGCLLVLLFGLVGVNLPVQFGLFLPLGYTQGPGQALALGKAWEAQGYTNAITIGLAFAAIGFFFALFVGVPLIQWGIRKGYTKMGKGELPDYFVRGSYCDGDVPEPLGHMSTHPGNVDPLAFQASAVGFVYLLTYALFYGLEQVVGQLGSSTWGFFFFFGMLVGILFRVVSKQLGAGHLLEPRTQTRITGFAVDILLTATLISVKLSVVWDNIVPLLTIALLGGAWTTFYMLYFGRRVEGYGFERMIAQYGCNTGTVSTGLVLLRVVDPEFKTGVAFETGIYAIFATPFIMTCMLIIVYAPTWGLNIYHMMGIFLGMTLLALGLLRAFRLWGKKQW